MMLYLCHTIKLIFSGSRLLIPPMAEIQGQTARIQGQTRAAIVTSYGSVNSSIRSATVLRTSRSQNLKSSKSTIIVSRHRRFYCNRHDYSIPLHDDRKLHLKECWAENIIEKRWQVDGKNKPNVGLLCDHE